MNINNDNALLAFKAVCNFINDLESEFGKRHKPLQLYKRLVKQTQICHEKIILKHLNIFNNFFVTNNEALMKQDPSKFNEKKIKYSERVYIDMELIFKIAADQETKDVIWKHILTIFAIIDPLSNAKETLKKMNNSESDFINKILTKIESSVKPDANPMEAVSHLMQSGVFNDMFNELKTQKLDFGKLLSSMQTMMLNMTNEMPQESKDSAKNLFSNILNSGTNNSDMTQQMLSLVTSFMSNNNSSEIKENSDMGQQMMGLFSSFMNNTTNNMSEKENSDMTQQMTSLFSSMMNKSNQQSDISEPNNMNQQIMSLMSSFTNNSETG